MPAPTTARPAGPHLLRFSPVLWVGIAVAALVAATLLGFMFLPSLAPGPSADLSPTSASSATAEPSDTSMPSLTTVPTASPTSPPSPSPDPTTAPTPTTGPATTWSRLVWSDPVTPSFTIHLLRVLPYGDGYVAAGLVRGEAAFLTSPDGLNWTVAHQLDRDAEAFPETWRLTTVDDELFAFSGSIFHGPSSNRTIGPPLVLRSVDGTTWSPVSSPSWMEAWADRIFFRVATGPGGLVAIGNAQAGEHGELFADPVVLHSTDGISWTRAELQGASARSVVWDVIGSRDGYALLGGAQTGMSVGSGPPEAWWSTDGLTWSKTTVAGALAGDSHFDSGSGFATEDGFIARTQLLSAGGHPDLRAWVSTDGQTWQRATELGVEPPSGLMAGDGARLIAFATDDGWTPLGDDPEPYPGLTRAWISTDAITWDPLELSRPMTDQLERLWVVPDGVIYAGAQSFWFGTLVP